MASPPELMRLFPGELMRPVFHIIGSATSSDEAQDLVIFVELQGSSFVVGIANRNRLQAVTT